jgi:hypothetical protein
MNVSIQANSIIDRSSRWNKDLGLAWRDVLKTQRLDLKGTVLEIGPGFTDKIAFGLEALDFRGRVILVDHSETACRWAVDRYRLLLPRAEVLTLNNPIPDLTALAKQRINAVVSNHIFDDLLLNAAVPRTTSSQVFSAMQPEMPCSSAFIESWKQLLSEPTRLETLSIRVVDDFMEYLDAIQPDIVAVNHYPSWRHSQCGLNAIHDLGLRMIGQLHQRLGNGCITYKNWLGPEQMGTVCWLLR